MRTLKAILLQANHTAAKAELVRLESQVLLPALFIIITFAVVAGVVICAQKYKRY